MPRGQSGLGDSLIEAFLSGDSSLCGGDSYHFPVQDSRLSQRMQKKERAGTDAQCLDVWLGCVDRTGGPRTMRCDAELKAKKQA